MAGSRLSIGKEFTPKNNTKKWREHNKILRSQDTTVHGGQTELNNMLVRKNVLNEINKEETCTQGFNDCRKTKRKVSQNLARRPSKLADKVS